MGVLVALEALPPVRVHDHDHDHHNHDDDDGHDYSDGVEISFPHTTGLGDGRPAQPPFGPTWPQHFREAWPAGGRDEGYGYGAHSEYRHPEYRPSSRGWNHDNYRNEDRGGYQYGDGGRRQDYRIQTPEYREDYHEHEDYRDGGSQGIGRPERREAEYPVHYSNLRGGCVGRRGKYERETSTDEGENTSNDAGDISSSGGESGSGRRRRRGRQSPAPAPPPRHQRTQSAGPLPPTPEQRKNGDSQRSPDKVGSPRVKAHLLKDKTPDNPKSVEDHSSAAKPIKGGGSQKNSPPPPPRKVEADANAEPEESGKEEEGAEKSEQPPPEILTQPSEEVVEDTSSEATQPIAPEMKEVLRRASLDRERKVGLGVPTPPVQGVSSGEKTNPAYQAMLAGARPPPTEQVVTEESTSDDMEAEFAALAKPRSKLHSTGGGFHNEEKDDPFAEETEESSPAPRAGATAFEPASAGLAGGGMGHMANLALSVGGGRGLGGTGFGGRGGLLGGHGGLVGGRLAHPAAQKVGMMAVREIRSGTYRFHI